MTKENKRLLLVDLCARLPYGVKVFYEYVDDLNNKTYVYSLTLTTWCIKELKAEKAVVKPYLRPLSSMTEEEMEEYKTISIWGYVRESKDGMADICPTIEGYDWLNAHHFDYRGLIERKLAIAVTEENNPYKD